MTIQSVQIIILKNNNYSELLAQWEESSPMVRETGVQSPGRVIPKTQKMVIDAALLSTQH